MNAMNTQTEIPQTLCVGTPEAQWRHADREAQRLALKNAELVRALQQVSSICWSQCKTINGEIFGDWATVLQISQNAIEKSQS